MDKSNVGICCAEKAFQAFRNAWNQTGLRPDKVLKDEDLYYIIWEDILWDDVLNARVKPLFDLMKFFYKTKVYIAARDVEETVIPYLKDVLPEAEKLLETVIPYLKDALPEAEELFKEDPNFNDVSAEEYLALYINEYAEKYQYFYIAIREDGYVETNGFDTLEFNYSTKLDIPWSAVLCDPDNPDQTFGKADALAYVVIRNNDKAIQHICTSETDAQILMNSMILHDVNSAYHILPIEEEWIEKKLEEDGYKKDEP